MLRRPRAYDMTLRAEKAEANRQKVMRAARKLLAKRGFHALSLEAVASAAGLTRMTVYKQFESKRGLFSSLLDDIGAEATRLREAAAHPKPREALELLIAATCRFWAAERVLFRRLLALGAVDPELEDLISERETRRRGPIAAIVSRLLEAGLLRADWSEDDAVEAVAMITSFASFDQLRDAEPSMQKLASSITRVR